LNRSNGEASHHDQMPIVGLTLNSLLKGFNISNTEFQFYYLFLYIPCIGVY